jgi:hypothetical protein
VTRPNSATSFVELISKVVFLFNIEDVTVEETTDQQLQAIVHRFPEATPQEHLRAVKILTSRLPKQPYNYRAMLSRPIDGKEVSLTTVNGFRFTWLAQLAKARCVKEHAEEFGFTVLYTTYTRNTGERPIKKKVSIDETPHASAKAPATVQCTGCGNDYHIVDTCRFKGRPFFNMTPYPYTTSTAHKALIEK